jgi:hypothetical protein
MVHLIPTIGKQSYNQAKNVTVIPPHILPHWSTSGFHPLSKQFKSSDVNSIVFATPLRARGSYLRLQHHLLGGELPQPNNLPHNLSEHPTQAGPKTPTQVTISVSPVSPSSLSLPPPDPDPDLPQEQNQDHNEETQIPIHGNVTRTRSGRLVHPPQRMNIKASKKHFGMDSLPVYAGRIETQVPPPKIRASLFNEQRIATLHWDRMVNTIKSGNFGAMMLEISKNTGILNDTLENLYPGILSAKENDEDTPTWHHAMNGPKRKDTGKQ